MYFIPRNNKWYSYLVVMPPYALYAFTVAFLFSLFFGWWSFFYAPLSTRVASLQLDYAHATHQQSFNARMQDDTQELEQSVGELAAMVDRSLHEQNSTNALMYEFLSKAAEAGLSLVSCVPDQKKNKGWYVMYPVDLQFVGSFSQIQQFLKMAALHEYALCVKHVAIHQHRENLLLLQCTLCLIGADDEQA